MKLEEKVKDALKKFIQGETDVMGRYEEDDGHHLICVEEHKLGHITIEIEERRIEREVSK